MEWVYALSPLGRVEVVYPSLGSALVLYAGAGVGLWLAAARQLHPSRARTEGAR
jgi:hypothetical protein